MDKTSKSRKFIDNKYSYSPKEFSKKKNILLINYFLISRCKRFIQRIKRTIRKQNCYFRWCNGDNGSTI